MAEDAPAPRRGLVGTISDSTPVDLKVVVALVIGVLTVWWRVAEMGESVKADADKKLTGLRTEIADQGKQHRADFLGSEVAKVRFDALDRRLDGLEKIGLDMASLKVQIEVLQTVVLQRGTSANPAAK